MTLHKDKKITLTTFKSFLKQNEGKLLVKIGSRFNGMTDGVDSVKDEFSPAVPTKHNISYQYGYEGIWCVGSSRDRFKYFEEDNLVGIRCFNSCGSFKVAIEKE